LSTKRENNQQLIENMDRDLALIEDFEAIANDGCVPRERTTYSEMDPLNFYPEEAFKRRYRMSKESFRELYLLLERDLTPNTTKGRPLSAEKQLLVALRYYATGSFQAVNGDAIGVSQSSVSVIVAKVSKSISCLYNQFITFPTNDNASEIMKGFYRLLEKEGARPFPGVIGAIDCTHVEVLAPGVPNRELFRNRKGRLSINVQAVCDAELNFTNVVVRWPGSVHDSRIFSNSEICARLMNREVDGWLLGDAGYGCKPYLMTPLPEPKTRSERAYNYAHIRSRNVIERAFGVIKKRFACLASVIRLDLPNALSTITACFVLHNFLRRRSDVEEEEEEEERLAPEMLDTRITSTQEGLTARESLIRRFF
jgi:hypothetical protein